jgi:methylthioribose-1-phosphate isomerase
MTHEPLRTLYWENGSLFLLDQRLLPGEISYLECRTVEKVAEAIRAMVVRGAPAIGISAAFGMVLGARQLAAEGVGAPDMRRRLAGIAAGLRSTRPTAVNLHWALCRMELRLEETAGLSGEEIIAMLEEEAQLMLAGDISTNRRIGVHGEPLIPDGASILTHCNAGALATAGYGTALGVIRAAAAAGKRLHVFVDETRPLLQGARLTARWNCAMRRSLSRLLPTAAPAISWLPARSTWSLPGPTVSPQTVIRPTRLALIRWPCWRGSMEFLFTSPRPALRLTFPWRTAGELSSKSAIPQS